MKHAGSEDDLLARLGLDAARLSPGQRLAAALRQQSGLSCLTAFVCALLLVAVVADAPVRNLARSLDPSVVAILQVVTQFGNSAWPLGLSLLLFLAVTVVSQRPNPFPVGAVESQRSALILVMGSVALSGAIASLTKNIIGRARPSTGDPHVFEFAFLSFKAGWAAFPSGHSTTAAAGAVALATIFPRQAFAWLSIGLLAALSRAFLGVHWLTDCLAGLALGVFVSLALRRRMEARGHKFRVDPATLMPVTAKGLTVGVSAAYGVSRGLSGRLLARIRRKAEQLEEGS